MNKIMAEITRRLILTPKAPAPVGPYSQAVLVDKTLYISGQIPLDPATGEMVEGGVEREAEQCLKNLQAILQEAGGDCNNVVKTTVLLQDILDWPKVNVIYEKYFSANKPARAAYAVAALPKGARVEIEAVAVIGNIKDV